MITKEIGPEGPIQLRGVALHLAGVHRLLALFVALATPTLFLPQTVAWREFALAFGRLPLP